MLVRQENTCLVRPIKEKEGCWKTGTIPAYHHRQILRNLRGVWNKTLPSIFASRLPCHFLIYSVPFDGKRRDGKPVQTWEQKKKETIYNKMKEINLFRCDAVSPCFWPRLARGDVSANMREAYAREVT